MSMTDDIVTRLRQVKSTSCSHIAGEVFVNFQLMLPYGANHKISALANVIAGCITIHSDAANEIERLRKERDEARQELLQHLHPDIKKAIDAARQCDCLNGESCH